MEFSIVPPCAVLECLVMLFQLVGVCGLCLTRFMPGTSWADRGRYGFVVALFGLGLAGAMCGRHDSQFALFAGVTMTALLIGMIVGGGAKPLTYPTIGTGTVEKGYAG